MNEKKFHEYLYELENFVDELVIGFLSFGFIIVLIDRIFYSATTSFNQLGQAIFPWVVMIGLMIIGRELWLLNRSIDNYLEER